MSVTTFCTNAQLLRAHEYCHQNAKETAKLLGLPHSTVRSRLSRLSVKATGTPGPRRKVPIAVLEEAIAVAGSERGAARMLGVGHSAARLNHSAVEKQAWLGTHPQRIDIDVTNGVGLIGSDAHIWPGPMTTAQRAFQYFITEYSPHFVCLNGDVIDGAKISRYEIPGWEDFPDPAQEIEGAQEILAQFYNGGRCIWTLGNHDWRFERYISKFAPHLKGLKGVHLKHYFPDWEPCWRLRINGNVNIKHRAPGGSPLARGRLAGQTIVTGHLHSLNVVRWSDYAGAHFSVDTGTLARVPGEFYVPQFTHYVEDNPVDWAAGFIVLTWNNSRLLWPEVVHVFDEEAGLVSFRGELINV